MSDEVIERKVEIHYGVVGTAKQVERRRAGIFESTPQDYQMRTSGEDRRRAGVRRLIEDLADERALRKLDRSSYD